MSCEDQKKQAKRLNDEAKRLYDKAMKKGYAECSTIKCLIHGSAGVGKTHVKHLLLKMPPPELRISTGIADNPIRAVTCLQWVCPSKMRMTGISLMGTMTSCVQ